MRSIVIIVLYLGRLPWHNRFFIESCKRNTDIDFIYFSDSFHNDKKDHNILEIPFSIDAFNELATKKIGFPIKMSSGYKICDFRPAFGLIFEDYLKKYDFWGYSDIDLILGRVREFITEDVLEHYDFISTKTEYPSGFFAIFKNSIVVNRLFLDSKDYKMVFESKSNMLFDECGGCYHELVVLGTNILNTDCHIETIHHVLERNKDKIKSLFEFFSIEGTTGSIKYTDGILSFANEFEVMLYHLSDFKNNIFLLEKEWEEIPPSYAIDKYLIRRNNFILKALSKVYQSVYPKLIFFLIRLLNTRLLVRNTKIQTGLYEYMREKMIVFLRNDCLWIDTENGEFPLCKSVLLRDYYVARGSTLVFFIKNSLTINLILNNGSVRTYSFVHHT